MHATEHLFTSHDGARLFYRAWQPQQPTGRAVLLFHRGHEHSARWQETARALALDGFSCFAWDQRGHGRSPGERGSADDLSVIIKDADLFARHICKTHGLAMENVAVVAHSVGAVIAAAWVHDFAPPIRAMILATPALDVKLYVPLALPALRLKQSFLGPGFVSSYVKPSMLTHDPFEAKTCRDDPLIFRQIAVNILLDLADTSKRLINDAAAIDVPNLILAAGRDWIVNLSAQKKFFQRLGSRVKQFAVLDGFYHAVFHEKERSIVIDKVRTFLADRFAVEHQKQNLLEADQGGFTRTEYDLLRTPGGPRWSIIRQWLKVGGYLSEGIGLGCRTGFDSGRTLDYVYENQPRGFGPIGRCIDWFYLNSVGWRGIRVRRQNLTKLLRECMIETQRAGRPVRILDIAAGAGRYVLETMKSLPDVPASAVLRDYRPENLDAAKTLADQLGVTNVSTEPGDAFDRDFVASATPRPTIAVVSGLFELIPENAPVLRALHGLADAMEPGGHLIYTNQPWHPQIEFIARALTNHRLKPWIMRRRAQAEMDALVASAGFEKIAQEIDSFGIFTVSIARRVNA